MSEEEKTIKNNILFQIDMKLYDEFNDKFCEINEHLGDIYTYKDLEDIKQAESDKERKLLREAIQKQEKVIDEMAQELINAPLRVFGDNAFKFRNKEDTKQYFYEKVDDNKNEN